MRIVHRYLRYNFFIPQRLRKATQPTPEWGPALDRHREMYIASLKNESSSVLTTLRKSDSEEHANGDLEQDEKPSIVV